MVSKMKNEKISIAMVANNLDTNGISAVIMNYCKHIDKNKFDINIIAGSPISNIHRKDAKMYGIKIWELPSRKKESRKYYTDLYKIFRKNKIDIVEVHGNSATITVELLIAWLNKIKIRIAHSHNSTCMNQKIHKILYPVFNRLYTQGFACSEMAGKWLFHDNKFEIIPNGFNVEKFQYSQEARHYIRSKIGIQEDDFVIGHVGRFNYQKNQQFLLNIFEKIPDINSHAKLLLIGNGPDLDMIKSIVNRHPYRERIIIYGETDEIEKIYSAMDVFVFPSRYEGLGIVAIEAQISGLSCIVSDAVPKDILVGSNVWFYSLKEERMKWILGIEKHKKSKEERKDFYKNNIKQIEAYDIKNNVKKLEKIYYNLLES